MYSPFFIGNQIFPATAVPTKDEAVHAAGSKSTLAPVCAPDTANTGSKTKTDVTAADTMNITTGLTLTRLTFKKDSTSALKPPIAMYAVLYTAGKMSSLVIMYASKITADTKNANVKVILISTAANGVFVLVFTRQNLLSFVCPINSYASKIRIRTQKTHPRKGMCSF